MTKPDFFMLHAFILAAVFSCSRAMAQSDSGPEIDQYKLLVSSYSTATPGFSSSNDSASNTTWSSPAFVTTRQHGAQTTATISPFSAVGLDWHIGLGGIGFDVATPLSRRFNLRVGSDFFGYSTTFQEEGATVNASLHLRSGHGSLDWFPFGGRFRISPQVIFANNNHATGTALVPGGSEVTLSGENYTSSVTDPLHGSGSIDFRKVAPGLSLGVGNIIPRTGHRLSVPVEVGFYYVGQPGLKVNFTGSACDPTQPASVGCQSVNQDTSFQQSLSAFIARNNNNLSYASFFPIFSIGVGYRF